MGANAEYKLAGAELKKTVSLKRPSTTAEHLYRQASLMFPFYVAL